MDESNGNRGEGGFSWGRKSKVAAVIIAILAVLGIGGYFILNKKGNDRTTSAVKIDGTNKYGINETLGSPDKELKSPTHCTEPTTITGQHSKTTNCTDDQASVSSDDRLRTSQGGTTPEPIAIENASHYREPAREPIPVFEPPFQTAFNALRNVIEAKGLKVLSGPLENYVIEEWTPNPLGMTKVITEVAGWEIMSLVNFIGDMSNATRVEQYVEDYLKFQRFMSVNGRHYTEELGFHKNFQNFQNNMKRIEIHNRNPDRSYDMGYSWATEYSDNAVDVLMQYNAGISATYFYVDGKFINTQEISPHSIVNGDEIILKYWRDENVVSPVINQGACLSSWAIAAASLIDSYRAIKTGKLVVHSTQQLLDCSLNGNCGLGGNAYHALSRAVQLGICEDVEYPYTQDIGECKKDQCKNMFKVEDPVKLDENSIEDHLMNHGPVLITMKVDKHLVGYAGGIFDGPCGGYRNQSLLIVGYGRNRKTGKEFWIVKNSWGVKWGYEGYFKLLKAPSNDVNEPNKPCLIHQDAYGML
ncbi:cysteine proteinases like protein [Babesia gibsoni]|uniref:Cysteine proteinases like protein n=1 Tax=Babesia gibsoni TaxID=33632 RepID=A0AAD8PEN1_BABGI|nr:cysteine proteinases like protein [Babesia gibsoni]